MKSQPLAKELRMSKPLIVGIGGTTRRQSSASHALRAALEAARLAGSDVLCWDGPFLATLPLYTPEQQDRSENERLFIDSVRRADGLIIATPAYHGGISGLVKNAIDLIEDLRTDERVYLDGRAVGCITTAFGWQGGGPALISLRSIIHALRGWPTPFGAMLNTANGLFDDTGACEDEAVRTQLALIGRQVVDFALMSRREINTRNHNKT
jgi:FMN reductase